MIYKYPANCTSERAIRPPPQLLLTANRINLAWTGFHENREGPEGLAPMVPSAKLVGLSEIRVHPDELSSEYSIVRFLIPNVLEVPVTCQKLILFTQ